MMEQQTKYIDNKKILATKEKISATVPRYIYDDIKNYSELTGDNTTDIVTRALFNYFKDKTLTNDYLLGYGNLYFQMPLNASFKADAIANKVKLNKDIKTTEPTETITIETITNNLDVFNGNTYFAGSEFEKRNIKHIGLDFIIIPKAIEPTKLINYNELDITILDALYIFYYEVSSVNNIDIYLLNPVDAVNKLSSVNSIKASDKLIACLQELENIETEINKNYADEIQELTKNNNYVGNKELLTIRDKYISLLFELLKETAIKFNNPYIKTGYDAFKSSYTDLKDKINKLKQMQNNIENITEYQEKEQWKNKIAPTLPILKKY